MRKHTGLGLGNLALDENASISIGNLGELYIDFGYTGGLLSEFVIGLIVSLVYRKLRDNCDCPAMITAGLCVMVVLTISYVERPISR